MIPSPSLLSTLSYCFYYSIRECVNLTDTNVKDLYYFYYSIDLVTLAKMCHSMATNSKLVKTKHFGHPRGKRSLRYIIDR